MDTIVHWTFYGYGSPGGRRRLVQEWFDGLSHEEKDEVRDSLVYLQNVSRAHWTKPVFSELGDGLSEIRLKVSELNKTIRLYGFFWPSGQRHSYTLLLGAEKKVKNPKHDISEARKRKSHVEYLKVSIYEFDFEDHSLEADSPISSESS